MVNSTVAPDSAVPLNWGCVTEVRESPLLPESDPLSKTALVATLSRVSMVKEVPVFTVVLPALSVTLITGT